MNDKSNYKIKEDIGYLPSEIYLYEDLTVKKMLEYSAKFYKKDCSKRINELVEILEIDLNKKISELSLGNLKKLGIILALMHNPKIIVMDEATSGLDPLMQEIFYKIIEDEKKKGTTIFFSSHNLSEVKRICDKVAIIKDGKIVELKNIKSLNNSNIIKITLNSKNISEIKENFNIEENIQGTELKFLYKNDINDFINKISKFNIDKLLIEELSLEEIFMHYYNK